MQYLDSLSMWMNAHNNVHTRMPCSKVVAAGEEVRGSLMPLLVAGETLVVTRRKPTHLRR